MPQANHPLAAEFNPMPLPGPILSPCRIADTNIRNEELRCGPVADSQEAQLWCTHGDDVVCRELNGAAVVGAQSLA